MCDVISVYTKMNENFKGGIDNVMLGNNDPIYSYYHQRCVDNSHWLWTHASVREKPIREKGWFGCVNGPVRDADWSVECSFDLSPVGDIRIEYIRETDNLGQSTDAAPLTELFDFYTLLHSVALVDDRPGFQFNVELCIPWDAPEVVVDIDSPGLVSLGSFPDKVGLFGRRKDAAVSRILLGRDSRSVRFLVPDARGVDHSYHDDDERETMVTLADITRLRELWPPEIFNHMKWFQQDLDLMRKSTKREYSQSRPMPCRFCGKVIRVDMYRHDSTLIWYSYGAVR